MISASLEAWPRPSQRMPGLMIPLLLGAGGSGPEVCYRLQEPARPGTTRRPRPRRPVGPRGTRRLLALNAAIWSNRQIGAPVKRSLISYDPLSCPYLPVNDLGDNIG